MFGVKNDCTPSEPKTNKGVEWRKYLTEQIRSMGLELIDRAEDIVGNGDMMMELDIWLRFRDNEIPEIEVEKRYAAKRTIDLAMRRIAE